jgi:tRNA dimethylallyltransferase
MHSVSPAAVLEARRRIVCPTCTIDHEKPVMIEQGREWEVHVRTKQHGVGVRRAKEQVGISDSVRG